MKIINIVNDFSNSPYGRLSADVPKGDEDTTGQKFRDSILAPALKNNDHVKVILTGYNRYGRSFIDQAFGGLIRESGFSYDELQKKLTYEHDTVKSIELLIKERIEKAAKDFGQLDE